MTEDDDTLLVRRALEGDGSAFEAIVDKYQEPLFNLALRFSQNRDDAQDITQASFIKAYEKLQTYDTSRKFFSWLYRIAVNESLNFAERKKNFQPLDETMLSQEDDSEDQEQQVLAERWIGEGLKQLKAEYRMVIVLKHLQDLSYTDISGILGISEKKVKSRLYSARILLRDALAKIGVEKS